MLKFHNGSANLANLVLFFSFFTLAVGSWLLANFKLRQPKAKSQ